MPIRADSACAERWSSFEPRPGGRHCGTCDVTVVDLSRVTRRKAEALVIAAGGHLCARLRVDARGAPIFRAEAPRVPGLLGAAALGLLTAACEPAAAPEAVPERPPPTAPSLLDDASPAHFGGSLMTVEHTPMRPLGEGADPPPPVVVEPSAPPEVALAVVPTEEQRLLTEAKEARERRGRGRRSRTTTASVAPGTIVHPLPPMGSPGNVATPPAHLYLGGISYTP